jgi:hypothetical protein
VIVEIKLQSVEIKGENAQENKTKSGQNLQYMYFGSIRTFKRDPLRVQSTIKMTNKNTMLDGMFLLFYGWLVGGLVVLLLVFFLWVGVVVVVGVGGGGHVTSLIMHLAFLRLHYGSW